MLDKSIESGKEHRRHYRKSKRFDRTCRNHGSCHYCESNRTASGVAKRRAADDKIREYGKDSESWK